MNPAAIAALLQAALTLLVRAQGPQASPATMQQAIYNAENTIQIIVQADAKIDFAVPTSTSNYPNIADLLHAPYLDSNGKYVQLGSSVQLIQSDTSFGDINHDGLDDAAVVVNRPSASGTPNYFLAVMVNHNNILFNIADYPLGPGVNITAHTISNGNIILNNTDTYSVIGTAILKTQTQ